MAAGAPSCQVVVVDDVSGEGTAPAIARAHHSATLLVNERRIGFSRAASRVLALEAGFDPTHGLPVWANPELVGGPPPELPNIVLVCLDTLRADRLSSYGHVRPTSPRLDAWSS